MRSCSQDPITPDVLVHFPLLGLLPSQRVDSTSTFHRFASRSSKMAIATARSSTGMRPWIYSVASAHRSTSSRRL
jgi:hypothetical protein